MPDSRCAMGERGEDLNDIVRAGGDGRSSALLFGA
jgi:hypothetical protein